MTNGVWCRILIKLSAEGSESKEKTWKTSKKMLTSKTAFDIIIKLSLRDGEFARKVQKKVKKLWKSSWQAEISMVN